MRYLNQIKLAGIALKKRETNFAQQTNFFSQGILHNKSVRDFRNLPFPMQIQNIFFLLNVYSSKEWTSTQ